MYCTACGQQLPAEALFCFKCGQSQKQDGSSAPVPIELCEVRRTREEGQWHAPGDVFWEAVAVGPRGRYSAARSITCPRARAGSATEIKRTDELLDTLVQELVRDGWKPLAMGREWYSYRFERRARPETDEPEAAT